MGELPSFSVRRLGSPFGFGILCRISCFTLEGPLHYYKQYVFYLGSRVEKTIRFARDDNVRGALAKKEGREERDKPTTIVLVLASRPYQQQQAASCHPLVCLCHHSGNAAVRVRLGANEWALLAVLLLFCRNSEIQYSIYPQTRILIVTPLLSCLESGLLYT